MLIFPQLKQSSSGDKQSCTRQKAILHFISFFICCWKWKTISEAETFRKRKEYVTVKTPEEYPGKMYATFIPAPSFPCHSSSSCL